MSGAIRPEDAETRVLQAALRVLGAGLGDMHADSGADAEYASEQLALAARDLAHATDASDRKPVGWDDSSCVPATDSVKPCGCLSFGEDCDECRTDPISPPSTGGSDA